MAQVSKPSGVKPAQVERSVTEVQRVVRVESCEKWFAELPEGRQVVLERDSTGHIGYLYPGSDIARTTAIAVSLLDVLCRAGVLGSDSDEAVSRITAECELFLLRCKDLAQGLKPAASAGR